MRRIIGLGAVALAILFVAGCPLFNPQGSIEQVEESQAVNTFELPADTVSDTARVLGGDFNFETLLPVNLNIDIDLYDPGAALAGAPALLPDGLVPVIVVLEDINGNNIYTGVTGEDGVFSAVVYLPAAPQNVVMKLFADGFEDREVTITDLVEYSTVSRTMGMALPFTEASASTYSRDLTGLEDSDGDGVPDVYDADPKDPKTAFVNSIPADGSMTIAFEDLFGMAQAGDADYNDFIAQYQITETGIGDGITQIRVDADAIVKLAGYWHRFGIRINSFDGLADLEGQYIDSDGNEVDLYAEDVEAPLEIDLFKDSRDAIGKQAWFTLTFDQEQKRGEDIENGLDDAPYNPYLFIGSTGHDVHLIGEEALNGSINPGDTFRDKDGFPWALLVPAKWRNPDESQRIETPYPRFTLWRESGGEEHSDWYNHWYDPWVPPADNNPPIASFPGGDYRVSGAGSVAVNGYYEQTGTLNGRPLYTQIAGAYKLFYGYLTGNAGFPPPLSGYYWSLDTDETTISVFDVDYWKYGVAELPPFTGWSAGTAITPAPSLTTVPISGSTVLGGTVTVEYIFSDPDGDGEGTSTYRWFRCDAPGDTGVVIPGAAGVSYTTVAADNGKFLKAEVTPVDDRGGIGVPVLSEASGQIGS